MKKRIAPICFALVLMFNLLTIPAFALLDESKYISSYSTEAIAEADGTIALDFSIRGTRMMDRIGAKKIDIYAREGNHWISAGSYKSTDAGMNVEDDFSFANTLYYSATPGTYYQIFITIFAEDSSGSDSRTEVHYVTARGNTQT